MRQRTYSGPAQLRPSVPSYRSSFGRFPGRAAHRGDASPLPVRRTGEGKVVVPIVPPCEGGHTGPQRTIGPLNGWSRSVSASLNEADQERGGEQRDRPPTQAAILERHGKERRGEAGERQADAEGGERWDGHG